MTKTIIQGHVPCYTVASWETLVDTDSRIRLIVVDVFRPTRVLASCSIRIERCYQYTLEDLFTRKADRRQGHARRLVEWAEDWAREAFALQLAGWLAAGSRADSSRGAPDPIPLRTYIRRDNGASLALFVARGWIPAISDDPAYNCLEFNPQDARKGKETPNGNSNAKT